MWLPGMGGEDVIYYPFVFNRWWHDFLFWLVQFPATGALLDAIDNSIRYLQQDPNNTGIFWMSVVYLLVLYFGHWLSHSWRKYHVQI